MNHPAGLAYEEAGDARRAGDVRAASAALLVWRLSALAALGIGLVSIAGWLFHVRELVQPIPWTRTFPFNAAAGLSVAGAGLLAASGGYRRTARIAAGIAGLIGAAALFQDFSGISLGTDELVVRHWLQEDRRMAANTSVSLVLAAVCIFLATRHRHGSRSSLVKALLASVIGAICLAAAVGYGTGLSNAYTWRTFSPMAPQAMAGLFFVAAAIFAAAWSASRADGGSTPAWLAAPITLTSGLALLVILRALGADEGIHTEAVHQTVEYVVTGFGVAVCAALGWSVHSWQRAANSRDAVHRANTLLEREMAERQRAEQATLERERLLQTILHTLPVGVYVTDPQGTIQQANPAGADIWAGVRVVGMEQYDVYRGWWTDTGEPVTEWPLARAIRNRQTSLNEMIDIQAFDGTRKTVLHSALPIVDEDANLRGAIAVIQDITARRLAEHALEARTRELERSNRDLEEFAYVASHDLQEPLRMVGSFMQLLARRYQGKLDADASEFIGFAVDGARRMQDLLNDLLTYSRAASVKQPIGAVSLGACARDAVANLQAAIRECGATVEVTTLPVVNGTPSQLTQVFQNLIGNALKFRSAAPPCVRITAHQQDGEWQVRVADNGIGIDPAQAERIFVIFQRLHPRERYTGTGVGLAICKKTVGRHGGRIWVEPGDGGGSTFVFTLPVVPTAVLPGEAA